MILAEFLEKEEFKRVVWFEIKAEEEARADEG